MRRISIVSAALAIISFIPMVIFFYNSPDLDYFLIGVFTIGVGPPSIAGILHDRWKNKIQKSMPDFLRDIATSLRTGVTLYASLEHASRRQYGPLTKELKTLVAHMGWGMSFEQALKELSDRVGLSLVEQATVLILEAGTHGGELSEVFDSTARYMDSVNTWTMRRRTQTMPYVAIFYFSVILFLFIIIVITRTIFVPISETSQGGMPLLRPILTPQESRRIFLHASILEAFFGGVLAGKINEDSFMSGLKHSMFLTIASGIAFYLFFR